MVDASRVGTIGSTEIRLAAWLDPEERYVRQYVPIEPRSDFAGATDDVFTNEEGVRLWSIRAWSGGEGEDVWHARDNAYRQSTGVVPVNLGEGLELARLVTASNDSGGASDLADAQRLGYGLGQLWTMKSNTGYPWDTTNGRWGTGIATGATANDATSLTDGDDTFMYSGHANGAIYRWKSGNSSEHFDTTTDPFTYAPVIRSFKGTLYALDGDDLYTIDKTVADTRTIVGDAQTGSSAVYLASTPWSYNRMSLSDKGPIWLQRLDNGQTFIWQYNEALDVQEILGKLPVDFAFPYSITFANGFIFVGFRYANSHSETGHAFVYFQRGAQRGVAGPFRGDLADSASEPVLVAGVTGDDLIAYFDGGIWAYNLTEGGIARIGATVTSGTFEDAATFGQEIFVAGASDKVDWADSSQYVASGTLSTGRYDMAYPGLRKSLLDVTVVTDPLPANTSVTMSVAVDGGSPVSLTGTHDTDNNRRYVWAGATDGTTAGYQFEMVVGLATTSGTATPTVRELIATATSLTHRIEWILSIDCSDMSHAEIDALNSLVGTLATFTDPWQNRESDSADSFVVVVHQVHTPELRDRDTPNEVVARMKLRSRDLVAGTGGS